LDQYWFLWLKCSHSRRYCLQRFLNLSLIVTG